MKPSVTLTFELIEPVRRADLERPALPPAQPDGGPHSDAGGGIWPLILSADHWKLVPRDPGLTPRVEPAFPVRWDLAEPVPGYPGHVFLPVGAGQGR